MVPSLRDVGPGASVAGLLGLAGGSQAHSRVVVMLPLRHRGRPSPSAWSAAIPAEARHTWPAVLSPHKPLGGPPPKRYIEGLNPGVRW